MIKIKDCFYDVKNDRYLTIDDIGNDPNVYVCIQEEPDWENDPDNLIVTGRILLKQEELEKMIMKKWL